MESCMTTFTVSTFAKVACKESTLAKSSYWAHNRWNLPLIALFSAPSPRAFNPASAFGWKLVLKSRSNPAACLRG